MAIKKHRVPGLDYAPITGADPTISYGIVEADAGEGLPRRTLEDVLFRRLFPTDRPEDRTLPWPKPTAERWDVLLNRGAPYSFRDVHELCRAYHRNDRGLIQHLAAIVTIRHPEVDERPASMTLADAWELSRGFALKLCNDLKIVAVPIMHVPGRSWGPGVPHCHICLPVRVACPGSEFTTFVTTLINPEEGRTFIDREWKAWRKAAGYGE